MRSELPEAALQTDKQIAKKCDTILHTPARCIFTHIGPDVYTETQTGGPQVVKRTWDSQYVNNMLLVHTSYMYRSPLSPN